MSELVCIQTSAVQTAARSNIGTIAMVPRLPMFERPKFDRSNFGTIAIALLPKFERPMFELSKIYFRTVIAIVLVLPNVFIFS